VTFDWRDKEKFAALYTETGSVQKMATYLNRHGVEVSPSTINNWRILHGIQVANENYRQLPMPVPGASEDRSPVLKELLHYLRTRTAPEGRLPKAMVTDRKYAIEVVGSDLHAPFQHDGAWEVFLASVEKLKPEGVTLAGDVLDRNQISRYTRKPSAMRPVQDDLDWASTNVFARVNAVAPDARRTLILGNHEYGRWLRYIYERVPELETLRVLDFSRLLGLEQLGWGFEPDGYELVDGLSIDHGDRHTNQIGGGSAMSARKEMIDTGISGVTGHTHHLGMFWRNDNAGYRVHLECGCLCDQDKMRDAFVTANKRGLKREDWHLGFAIIYYHPNGQSFSIEPVSILTRGKKTWAIVSGEEVMA